MDITELYQFLSVLPDKLKRNRELVSLSELKTEYRGLYTALYEDMRAATSVYANKTVLQGIRIRREYSKEATAIIETSIKQSGLLRQISITTFKRQNIKEIEQLSHTPNKRIVTALEPFYYQHLSLYLTEDCFADSPRTSDIYSDVNGYILCDGKWIPGEILYGKQSSAAQSN